MRCYVYMYKLYQHFQEILVQQQHESVKACSVGEAPSDTGLCYFHVLAGSPGRVKKHSKIKR